MTNYEVCEKTQRYIVKGENEEEKEAPGDIGAGSRRVPKTSPSPGGDSGDSSDGGMMKLFLFGIGALFMIGVVKYIRSKH